MHSPASVGGRPRGLVPAVTVASMLALVLASVPSAGFTTRQAAGLEAPSQALPIQQDLALCDLSTVDVSLTGPDDGTWQSSPVAAEWSTTGSAALTDAGVLYHRLGDGWTIVDERIDDDGHHPLGELPDGEYWVYVWVRDQVTDCYAEAWSEVSFRLDSQPPSVDVLEPRGIVGSDARITWCTSEEHPDSVDLAYRSRSESDWTPIEEGVTDTDDCRSYRWSTDGLADGRYRVRVTARDRAGNADDGLSRTFMVDATRPTALILAPADGDHHEAGLDAIVGDAVDDGSGVASTELRLRSADGRYLDATAGMWLRTAFDNRLATDGGWRLDLPALAPGGYRATLVVEDAAGNVDEATVAFTVGDGGNGSGPGPLPGGGTPIVGPDDVTDLGDGRQAFDLMVGDDVVRRVRGIVDGPAAGTAVDIRDLATDAVSPPSAERVCAAFDLSLQRDGTPVETEATLTVVSPRCEQPGERPVLYHRADAGWEAYPAETVGGDADRTYYKATVDGFSPFALGAEAVSGTSAIATIAIVLALGGIIAASVAGLVSGLSRD